MSYLFLVGGFVLLLTGGEALVKGAVGVARRFEVSPLLIGLTLVGFGTSTPELITSVEAALRGSPGIAVGNIVGSNIFNILFILGLAAVVQPLRAHPDAFVRDGTVLALSAVACVTVAAVGSLTRPVGALLVLSLAVYVIYTYRRERRAPDAGAELHASEAAAADPAPRGLAVSLLLAVGGIALTIGGATLLVEGAIDVARTLGVSETVIGLTVVAAGTSLPELVTSIVAGLRKQPDVAYGNIVGSNIYNILGILGVTALIQPIPVPSEILRVDVWVMLAATFLMLFFTWTGWRLSRAEGLSFLAGYVAYVAWLAVDAF
jgi:cation:H+ antiporter